MNTPPLHRLPVFWLGILLLLLTATWLHSCFYSDEAAVPYFLIENRLGFIGLTANLDGGFSTYIASQAVHPRRFWFPYPFATITLRPGTFGVSIAHWLLILLTLITWLVLLIRKRKHLRLLTESVNQQTPHP